MPGNVLLNADLHRQPVPRPGYFRPLIVCLLLCVAGSRTGWADQQLRWKLAAGETLRYRLNQSMRTESMGPGKPMAVVLDFTMTVTWKVESVDERQIADITQTVDQFRMVLTADKRDPIVYDSASSAPVAGPAREIADGVQPFLGASCLLRLTNRGEVLAAQPSDPLRRALDSAKERGVGEILSPDGLRRLFGQAAVLLPEEAIAPGASWESTEELPTQVGRIRQLRRFTDAGPEDRDGASREKLTFESQLTLSPAADSPAGSTKLTAGRQTGSLWFAVDAGRLVESELEQQLDTERPYRDLKIIVRSAGSLSVKLLPSPDR